MTGEKFFDREAGEAGREDGLRRVDDHAKERWKVAAQWAVVEVAKRRDTFTTDDVWFWLASNSPNTVATHEPRAMGAVMRTMAKKEYIAPLEEHRMSERAGCHRRPLRVWRSKVREAGL